MKRTAEACAALTVIYFLVRPRRKASTASLMADMNQMYANTLRIALGENYGEPKSYEEYYRSFPSDSPYEDG